MGLVLGVFWEGGGVGVSESGVPGIPYLGDGQDATNYVVLAVWPRRAASTARRK
jgi:hypothetical protein